MLVGAYVFSAGYNTGIQLVQRRDAKDGLRFDPLTTLLYVAPATALCLAGVASALRRLSRKGLFLWRRRGLPDERRDV